MAIVTADSFGIPFDGSSDVRLAFQSAWETCVPGDTFQLHAGGLYLTTFDTPILLFAPGVTLEGNGASIFRNQRRTAIKASPTEDILQVRGNNITVQNLKLFGFRKDEYTGEKLTTVAGVPTVVGSTVELRDADEEVRLPLVGLDQVGNPKVSTNFETPFYFRSVDGLNRFEAVLSGTGGHGDAIFCLYDDDTDALVHSQSFTPTTTPTVYEITFDPTPAHLGTRFRVTIKKETSGGVITVHSITPYGECGFRRADTTWFTGGNEFSDAIQVQDVVGTIIQDCEMEGPDGDGINCATVDTDTIIRRCIVRGNGRQGYTLHRSTNLLIEDCVGREIGRSGVDYEPNNVAHVMVGTLLRRCEFINVRNYGIAIRHWAKNINAVMEDVTFTNTGLGALSGGGRPMTIRRMSCTGTYRTDADRVANGQQPYVDIEIYGIDMTVDDLTVERGIALPDITNRSNHFPDGPIVEYHPSDIHVTNAVITDPEADPPVFIYVANSTVDWSGGTVGTTAPTWDDTRYNWDSDQLTWDGLLLGAPPAFQLDAFQENAFQVALVIHVFATQTIPSFTQHLAGFAGRSVLITQEIPAFTQAAEIAVQVEALVAQAMPAFTQAADVALQVTGNIGKRQQTFQEDAFQEDAFQTQANTGETMPAFTQHLNGAVLPHGGIISIVHQSIPAFTQAADGTAQSGIVIAQTMPSFIQSIHADLSPFGAITQTLPSFMQSASVLLLISSDAVIHQTIPMFTQHLRIRMVRYDEWPVSSTEEWLVDVGEEWLVRR